MSTTEIAEQQLLIGGEWRGAAAGNTFERSNPFTGAVATTASAAGREDARAAVEAAHAAFAEWSATGPGAAPRAALARRRPDHRAPERDRRDDDRGDRRNLRLGHVQLHAGLGDVARGGGADLRHDRRGDPLRHPRQARDGGPRAGRRRRRHRAVERARDPLDARRRDAARVRQHGRAQGLRAVPTHARARGERDRRRRRPAPA